MYFPEIVIKMIQYLVGLVLRGLISTFVYVLITDDRLFKPLFEVTELLPFILSQINWTLWLKYISPEGPWFYTESSFVVH